MRASARPARHSASGRVRCAVGRAERISGAQKRTRTSTPLRAPAPEAGASTNSAIWARGRERALGGGGGLVNESGGARRGGCAAPRLRAIRTFGGGGVGQL